MIRCTPSITARKCPNGTLSTPETAASTGTRAAPAVTPTRQPDHAARYRRQDRALRTSPSSRRYIPHPARQGTRPMLMMLQPRASRPPSWNMRHWTMRMAAMVMIPAAGPMRMASSTPPPRWPLVPGIPGSVKLIIWAAKTKAPITPISGSLSASRVRLASAAAMATATAARASVPAATGMLSSSLAMCIASKDMSSPLPGGAGRVAGITFREFYHTGRAGQTEFVPGVWRRGGRERVRLRSAWPRRARPWPPSAPG